MPCTEEFPAEELAGVPDWNAAAWACILVRDGKKLVSSQRGAFLAARSLSDLAAMKSVLTQEEEAADLLDEVAAEIARRSGDN